MPLTRQEFEELKTSFLETLDDTLRDSWFTTERCLSAGVLGSLEKFLFGDLEAKEARRLQYEEPEEEFEPTLTAARSPPVRKTIRKKP